MDDLEQRLLETEARFRVMADTAPVLLWMAGTDGLCNFFNQPWLTFTGRPLEMEIGNGWAEGVHPEDFQQCMDTYMSAFVARRKFRMEYRLRRADGQYRWLLDTGVPRYAPSGEFAGYIGSCIDVTELRAVRDQLEQRVRERTAELEAFAYSVSHDLRAPLRSIDGFSQLVAEDYAELLDDQGKDYLQRIRKAAQRMGQIIDELLQLSNVGRSEMRAGEFDLSALVAEVAKVLTENEPARRVEVRVEPGMRAHGDARLVRVALENLLGNAWKFTRNKSVARIEVGKVSDGASPVFFVRDNGAGFDMAFASKLFRPFHRLHGNDEFPGTGIGLATVERIVRRHGGRIWAEGAVDRGATFSWTLPPPDPARG